MALQMPSAASTLGFADPVRDSQAVFRAVMNALARPTTSRPLPTSLSPPPPLTPELAAVAMALADGDASIWLDPPLSADPAVAAYLRFHTGAPIVADPALAAFALVSDPAALSSFDQFELGSEEFPDRSTTIVLAVESFDGGDTMTFQGPGLKAPSSFSPTPVPIALRQATLDNRALFPRGIDLIFVAPGLVAALPRSSRMVGGH